MNDLAAPPPAAPAPEKESFWKDLRRTLLAGLAIFLPAVITFWFLLLLDSPFRRPFEVAAKLVGEKTSAGSVLTVLASVPGLGLLVALILILLVGMLARNYLGHHLLRWADEVAMKIPVVRSIYSSVKQVSDTVFTSAGKQAFREAVLVRFPNADSYAIGFVTGEAREATGDAAREKMVNVFVPTAPNPTSGFLLMIPAGKLVPANMSVEQAFKMVISGGVVMPSASPALTPPPPSAAGEPSRD